MRLLYKKLADLKTDDLERFSDFIDSPYIHKQEKVTRLFHLIYKYAPNFNINTKQEEAIQVNIFGDNDNAAYFAVLLNKLNELLEEYFTWENLQKQSHFIESARVQYQLEQAFNHKYYARLKDTPPPFLHHNFELLESRSLLEYHNISFCESQHGNDTQRIAEHSRNYLQLISEVYAGKYLEVYANLFSLSLNRNLSIDDLQKDIGRVESILGELGLQEGLANNYLHLIELFKGMDDTALFEKNFSELISTITSLPAKGLNSNHRHILLLAKNACLLRGYQHERYYAAAFEITRFLLQNNLYFQEHTGDQFRKRFILIVKIALFNNDSNWAHKFIDQYIAYFGSTEREQYKNYALGLLYFHEKEFGNSLKSLIRVQLSDPYFVLDYKLILLKTYYELQDKAGFLHHANAHKKYLEKKKSLNKDYVKNVRDIITYIRLLFNHKNGKKSQLEAGIRDRQLAYLISDYRDKWLKEKFDALN